MNKFLKKIALWCGVGLALHVIAGFFASGKTDAFYLRFTTPKKSSLIIGTSRAAQGLMPSVINPLLGTNMLNFGFTLDSSPYGEVYNHAIEEKLDESTQNGIFILSVEPWSLSSAWTEEGKEGIPEEGLSLGTVKELNQSPNYEYLVREYAKGWGFNVLEYYGYHPTEVTLHPDGWLEVDKPLDPSSIASRTKGKIKHYRENAMPGRKISDYRMSNLKKLIGKLKQHGKVYLVRLPVSPEMYDLEHEFCADFDAQMQSISETLSVPYNAMQSEAKDIVFSDGNHISRYSTQYCSQLVAKWILSQPEL
jgi:hypothetical protein